MLRTTAEAEGEVSNLTPVTSIICIPLPFTVLGKRDTWKRRRQMTNVTLGSGGWVAIK